MWSQIWNTVRKNAVTVTACLGLIGGAGAAVKSWPDIEPLVPAQRYYVNDKVAEYKPVINQLLKWQAEDQKSKIESERAQWSIKLPTERDAQVREMIQRRIEQLNREQTKIDDRVRGLK